MLSPECRDKGKVKGDIPLSAIPAGTFIDPPEEFKYIFQPILFDYDKSDVRADMQAGLNQVAEWMKTHPKVLVRIEGHCDERGTEQYNLALGERRALSVRRYLNEQGVPADRLFTISYGEEQPRNTQHTEIAWAENRRAEFKLAQ
jgi:peptidoglycan-associated lipoprotein